MVTHIPAQQDQHLLLALKKCEEQLHQWANASEFNFRLLSEDLAAALEAADLQLDLSTMLDLEAALCELAQKLDLVVPHRRNTGST